MTKALESACNRYGVVGVMILVRIDRKLTCGGQTQGVSIHRAIAWRRAVMMQ